jgi:hypothetical protein
VERIDTQHPIEVISVKLAANAPRRKFENADVAFIPVTRFNLRMQMKKDGRSAHLEGRHLFESPGYDEFWLHRIEMFERLCVPSVLNLTPRPDAWFIAFGETRPPYVRELIERLQSHPWIRPYYPSKGYPDADTPLPMLLAEHARSLGKQFLCSTRFDSDDSLHQQFYRALDDAISQMRALGLGDETRCLNLLFGLVESGGDLSIYLRRSNMFESIFTSVASPEGPYGGPHDTVRQRMPLVEIITNLPMWMYHRHGDSLDRPGVIVPDRVPLPPKKENLAQFGLTLETMAAERPDDNRLHDSEDAPALPAVDPRWLAGELRGAFHWNAEQRVAAVELAKSMRQPVLATWLLDPNADSLDLLVIVDEIESADLAFLDAAALALLAGELVEAGHLAHALRMYDSAVQLSPSDRHLRSNRDALAGSLQETLDLQEQRELAALVTHRNEQTAAVVMVTMAARAGSIDPVSERTHERAVALVRQGFAPYVVTVPESTDEREPMHSMAIEQNGVTYRSLGNHGPYPNGQDSFRRALTKELATLVAELRPCLLTTDGSFTARRMTAAVARAFSLTVEF